MRSLCGYVFGSLVALAAGSVNAGVPHTFNNGEVADAAKINDNFNALDGRLTTVESVTPDPSTLANEQFGLARLSVDCTQDNTALQQAWGEVLALGNVRIDIAGDCLEPNSPLGGIDLGGHHVFISGKDPTTGLCNAKPKLLDGGDNDVGIYLNLGASLWLECLQLGTTQNVLILSSAGDYLRLDEVVAGSGTLNVWIRNNGLLRELGNSQLSSLKLERGSVAEFNHSGTFAFSIPTVTLSDGSHLISRFAQGGTVQTLTLKNGSAATFQQISGGSVVVTDLTASGRSYVFESGSLGGTLSVTNAPTLTQDSLIYNGIP